MGGIRALAFETPSYTTRSANMLRSGQVATPRVWPAMMGRAIMTGCSKDPCVMMTHRRAILMMTLLRALRKENQILSRPLIPPEHGLCIQNPKSFTKSRDDDVLRHRMFVATSPGPFSVALFSCSKHQTRNPARSIVVSVS